LEKQSKEVEERAKAQQTTKQGSVDITAVEPVEADFKIQTARNEKRKRWQMMPSEWDMDSSEAGFVSLSFY
jgi:hypothetical protein